MILAGQDRDFNFYSWQVQPDSCHWNLQELLVSSFSKSLIRDKNRLKIHLEQRNLKSYKNQLNSARPKGRWNDSGLVNQTIWYFNEKTFSIEGYYQTVKNGKDSEHGSSDDHRESSTESLNWFSNLNDLQIEDHSLKYPPRVRT